MKAYAYKRKSQQLSNGIIVPAAGKVVVGEPGKNMRKNRRLKVYESDHTELDMSNPALPDGVQRIVPGGVIYVEKESDLPGYGNRLDKLNGWVPAEPYEVDIKESEVHVPRYGRVDRKKYPITTLAPPPPKPVEPKATPRTRTR